MRHTVTVVLFAVLVPVSAFAQTCGAPPEVNQVLATNPLTLIAKWVTVEFERKIAPAVTVGGSASFLADLDQSNAAALVRWYPQQKALEGFYLGARAGAYRFKTTTYQFQPSARATSRERHDVLPGAGVELGYNWLLGPRHNVSVGVGFGLTRIIGGGASYDVPSVLPGARLVNIGVAF